MLDNDDLPMGRVLSRREVIALLGSAGAAAFLSACMPAAAPIAGATPAPSAKPPATATPMASAATTTVAPTPQSLQAPASVACVVRPELTEGPLFVDEELDRSDIRLDPSNGKMSEGIPLELTFHISSIASNACAPLAGVKVDIWHCDVYGVYSDTNQLGMNSLGQKFLRGYQISDESGVVKFVTIYPGWYQGRAVHIHFKIRTDDGYDFTSQLFFDDTFTDEVYTQPPYNSRGQRSIRNGNDGIYGQSGADLLLAPEKTDTGYAAIFDVALDLT